MNLLTFCLFYIFLPPTPVRPEDQHCMDKATKEISVEIGGDNPQRVIAYIRDEPGYQVNLQCKWILKPATYDKPTQMYIQIPVVDFDVNNVTDSQCRNVDTKLDVLIMKLKLDETDLFVQTWCSDESVKVKRFIVNLWDPSYILALEFRSDDKQVRSDAKGVQVDVQVLGRDYCHRTMLYLNGSCYAITPDLPLTSVETFLIAKNYLGNVITVPKDQPISDFFRKFFQQNADREGQFPYESPLALAGRQMWTGYFVTVSVDDPFRDPGVSNLVDVEFYDQSDDCEIKKRQLNVFFNSSTAYSEGYSRCAVAVRWARNGNAIFTCESMELKLPALIEFKQIPAAKGDTHPQLFTTCNLVAPLESPSVRVAGCGWWCMIVIVVIGSLLCSCVIALVAGVLVRKRRLERQRDGKNSGSEAVQEVDTALYVQAEI